MKFKINSNELKTHLDRLYKVVPKKTTLSILETIKLVLTDEELILTASDLNTTIVAHIVPEEVLEEGSICATASKLTEVVKTLKDEIITISTDAKNNLIVKTKSGRFKISTAEDVFPFPDDIIPSSTISLPAQEVVRGINKIMFCTYRTDVKPWLDCIYFDVTPTATVLAATDAAWVVGMYKIKVGAATSSILVPKSLAMIISSIVGDDESDIEIGASEKNVCVEYGQYAIYARSVENNYPQYKNVIPKTFDAEIRADVESSLAAMKRTMIFADSENNTLYGEIKLGQLDIKAEDLAFNLAGEEIIFCENIKDTSHFKVRGRKLEEILSKIDEPNYRLMTSGIQISVKPDIEDNYMFVLAQQAGV